MRTFVCPWIIQARTIQYNQGYTASGSGSIELQHLWIYFTFCGIFGGIKGHNDSVFEITLANIALCKKMRKVHVFSFGNVGDVVD
jgi:hypothetical protein